MELSWQVIRDGFRHRERHEAHQGEEFVSERNFKTAEGSGTWFGREMLVEIIQFFSGILATLNQNPQVVDIRVVSATVVN